MKRKTASGARKMRMLKDTWLFYAVAGLLSLACLLPFVITLSSSLSSEEFVNRTGYTLFPKGFTLETYRYIIENKGEMFLRAFGITFVVVIAGTLNSLVVTACFAYSASQKKEVYGFVNAISFIAWFTTIFSGGLLPWYILTTKYYHLQNNLFALFIPSSMGVFNMFILKNNFKAMPQEIVESAKIDGAGNLRVFLVIALPLTKVALVTITLFCALGYWNDFNLSLYLITKTDLYTVQKMLYNMLSNISALMSNSNMVTTMHIEVPTNTARMAMTVMTIAPVLAFYPFAQKYFVKGVTIGAVKG